MLIVSMVVMMVVIFGGLILVLRKVLSQNVSLATRHLEELNDDYAKKRRISSVSLKTCGKKPRRSSAKPRRKRRRPRRS